MVTKNTENNANNALNILPESASTAVDNDEKYLSFALVLAITIMGNLVKLIGTDGFILYTYTLQDTATARAVFNELARRLKNFNRQEEVYTTDSLTFRMKYIYGVTLFEHDSKSILNLFDKKGYPVLSESGEPGSLDDMYLDIQARLHGGYASKKFLHLHELNRPGFPGECFICELRLPDHRFRWKHNKLFLLLPEEYGPAFPAIV
ncbi:hypothetical protein, partial [Escherichia coli]